MEHYVTLFDSLFLPQGLALHASMQRNAGSHTLWVLCMDTRAHEILSRLALPNVRLLALADVETPDLLRIKPSRTRGEYCWTMTSSTPKFIFDADASVQRVTYLDADLWFRQNPAPIFEEFDRSGKSVLITEHAYAPEFDRTHLSGKFCVQFMVFVRGTGEPVRTRWAEQCIDWCYARLEDGKFGDQMYLDDWPERFPDEVHVLQKKELVQGPWNTARFLPSEAVTFHFHGLRLLGHGKVLLTDRYPIFAGTNDLLYEPYLRDLRAAVETMRKSGIEAAPQMRRPYWMQRLRGLAKGLVTAPLRAIDRGTPRFGNVR